MLTWSTCISYICFVLILITQIYIPYLIGVCLPLPIPIDTKDWVVKIVFNLGLKKIPATRSLPYGTCHFTYGICTNGIWNTKVPCFLMAFRYSSSKARGMERYFLSLSNELTREWMLSVLTTFNIELCLLHNENWDWNSRYHQNKQHICILFFIFLPIITIENKSNVMYHFNERKLSSWIPNDYWYWFGIKI